MEIEMVDNLNAGAKLRVVGIGGGGNNALDNMIANGIKGVEFIAANTDMQALERSQARTILQLGRTLTRGLGAGADPEVGRQAALEDRDKIKELLAGSDMVFVTAGMGGGTGTGGAPVVAEVAKELGALTVAVVTKPFDFEGKRRQRQAEKGLEELKKAVDTLIVIPNTRLMSMAHKNARFSEMLAKADEVLLHAVKGISELITNPGKINLDFADVRTVMSEMGIAIMGTGEASGDNRAMEAAKRAVDNPLLDDISIDGARGVLFNITAGDDITMAEISEASRFIQEAAHEDANVFFGCVLDPEMGERMRITVIATGIGDGGIKAQHEVMSRPHIVGGGVPTRESLDPSQVDHLNLPRFSRSLGMMGHGERRGGHDSADPNMDTLDVPTFLRRQAD